MLSRLVQGAGGGINGVIQAYVADAVPGDDRAKALGWLTAATSAGVMVGPLLGSLSTRLSAGGAGLHRLRALPGSTCSSPLRCLPGVVEPRRDGGGQRARAAGAPGAGRDLSPPWRAGAPDDLGLHRRHDGVHGDERRPRALPRTAASGSPRRRSATSTSTSAPSRCSCAALLLGPLINRFGEVRAAPRGLSLVAGQALLPLPGQSSASRVARWCRSAPRCSSRRPPRRSRALARGRSRPDARPAAGPRRRRPHDRAALGRRRLPARRHLLAVLAGERPLWLSGSPACACDRRPTSGGASRNRRLETEVPPAGGLWTAGRSTDPAEVRGSRRKRPRRRRPS